MIKDIIIDKDNPDSYYCWRCYWLHLEGGLENCYYEHFYPELREAFVCDKYVDRYVAVREIEGDDDE